MPRFRGRANACAGALVFALALSQSGPFARAADSRHFSFGYDQPHTTGYGIAADLFNAKLVELSKGAMTIDQFPGAQLGQEPQMLQKSGPAISIS
jgi:TRAP-type transport system periplasmic protein